MMRLRGICKICGRLADYTCSSCGALVCGRDYNKEMGLCIKCYQGRKR